MQKYLKVGFSFRRVNPTRADLYYKCILVMVQSASGEKTFTQKAQIWKLTRQRHPIVGQSSPFASLVVWIQRCACAWVHLLNEDPDHALPCKERRVPSICLLQSAVEPEGKGCVRPYIGSAQAADMAHRHISTPSTFPGVGKNNSETEA